MKITSALLYFLCILVGGTMFVYAGVDDSPGEQLLGVLVGAFGMLRLVKRRNKS